MSWEGGVWVDAGQGCVYGPRQYVHGAWLCVDLVWRGDETVLPCRLRLPAIHTPALSVELVVSAWVCVISNNARTHTHGHTHKLTHERAFARTHALMHLMHAHVLTHAHTLAHAHMLAHACTPDHAHDLKELVGRLAFPDIRQLQGQCTLHKLRLQLTRGGEIHREKSGKGEGVGGRVAYVVSKLFLPSTAQHTILPRTRTATAPLPFPCWRRRQRTWHATREAPEAHIGIT